MIKFSGIKHLWHEAHQLLFPHFCLGCFGYLPPHIDYVCYQCQHNLPQTNFHLAHHNPVFQSLSEQHGIVDACAFYFFQDNSPLRNLIHHLKYKNQPDIGVFLGKKIGKQLLQTNYQYVDIIVPVPLHEKKTRQRGYNQSQKIALGIAELLNKPIDTSSLIRKKNTQSQARLQNSKARAENLEDAFSLCQHEHLFGKHILLIDDVLTTGSTINACIQILCTIPQVQISVLTVAVAGY